MRFLFRKFSEWVQWRDEQAIQTIAREIDRILPDLNRQVDEGLRKGYIYSLAEYTFQLANWRRNPRVKP